MANKLDALSYENQPRLPFPLPADRLKYVKEGREGRGGVAAVAEASSSLLGVLGEGRFNLGEGSSLPSSLLLTDLSRRRGRCCGWRSPRWLPTWLHDQTRPRSQRAGLLDRGCCGCCCCLPRCLREARCCELLGHCSAALCGGLCGYLSFAVQVATWPLRAVGRRLRCCRRGCCCCCRPHAGALLDDDETHQHALDEASAGSTLTLEHVLADKDAPAAERTSIGIDIVSASVEDAEAHDPDWQESMRGSLGGTAGELLATSRGLSREVLLGALPRSEKL